MRMHPVTGFRRIRYDPHFTYNGKTNLLSCRGAESPHLSDLNTIKTQTLEQGIQADEHLLNLKTTHSK